MQSAPEKDNRVLNPIGNAPHTQEKNSNSSIGTNVGQATYPHVMIKIFRERSG